MTNQIKLSMGLLIVFIAVSLLFLGSITVQAAFESKNAASLKGQAAWPENLEFFDASAKACDLIEKYTNGHMRMDLRGPGSFVPAMNEYPSVSTGGLDFGIGCPCYAKDKSLAVSLFCDSPGNLSGTEKIVWLYHEGGLGILQDLFKKHLNVKVFPIALHSNEVFLFTNKEINTLEDMMGQKMRAAGMRSEIYKYIGGSLVVLGGGAIIPAMLNSEIDAYEFSNISCGDKLGFYDAAKYAYYMPMKSAHSMQIITINMNVWNNYSTEIQSAIEQACYDTVLWSLTRSREYDILAMKKATEEHGVTIKFLPKKVNKEFYEIACRFYAMKAENDPEIDTILQSWDAFAEKYEPYAPFINCLDNAPYVGMTIPYKKLKR